MSVPAFRNSRSRVRRRRSHHKITATEVTTCSACQAPIMPHRACASCGTYNKRQVTDVKKDMEKAVEKAEKKATAKAMPKAPIEDQKVLATDGADVKNAQKFQRRNTGRKK